MLFAAGPSPMTGYGALAKATDLDRLFVFLNTGTYALAFRPHLSFSSLLIAPSGNLLNFRSNGRVPFYSTDHLAHAKSAIRTLRGCGSLAEILVGVSRERLQRVLRAKEICSAFISVDRGVSLIDLFAIDRIGRVAVASRVLLETRQASPTAQIVLLSIVGMFETFAHLE